ncbi:MAG: DUF3267 domain-containing protein [Bacteroidetes bacterium]|nr:DUF3267 domain-containing protein [Bacteroidota bacterium]
MTEHANVPAADTQPTSLPLNAHDVSMSMARVNILAIPVAIVPVVLLGLLFVAVNGWGGFSLTVALFRQPLTLFLVLIGGVLAHELLHGAAWAHFGNKPLTAITFGIHWPTLTPFAHCKEPLSAEAYRIGALTPALLLGIAPSLLAIFAGAHMLLFPGLVFTAAAAGDFLIVWMLRGVRSTQMVLDHPDRAGCLVYDLPPSKESFA